MIVIYEINGSLYASVDGTLYRIPKKMMQKKSGLEQIQTIDRWIHQAKPIKLPNKVRNYDNITVIWEPEKKTLSIYVDSLTPLTSRWLMGGVLR